MAGLKAFFLKKLSETAYAIGRYAITSRKTRAGAVVPSTQARRSVVAFTPAIASGLAHPLHLLPDLVRRLVHDLIRLHAFDVPHGEHPAGQVLIVVEADERIQLLAVPVVEWHALRPDGVEEFQHVHPL